MKYQDLLTMFAMHAQKTKEET